MDTSRKRRRNKLWPEALKREIVAATFEPGASVARQYDVNTNQVFSWRRRYGEASQPPVAPPSASGLVPVTIAPEPEIASTASPAIAQTIDHHRRDLAPVVPGTPHWRLAHLPPRLSWTEVRRAIDALGRATPIDVRDRAILLLLATTGIRNGELRALRLQDIDWRIGEVFIRHTKGKRDRVAPLLEETGAALADYVIRARPKADSAYLFLSFKAPVGPLREAAAVSRIVRKRLRCSGIELGRVAGAHLLRHSLATELVEKRRPINEIADLLGHRSINTTALYVKVATSQLALVALPFPGGASFQFLGIWCDH